MIDLFVGEMGRSFSGQSDVLGEADADATAATWMRSTSTTD